MRVKLVLLRMWIIGTKTPRTSLKVYLQTRLAFAFVIKGSNKISHNDIYDASYKCLLPNKDILELFNTLPICYRHIVDMHIDFGCYNDITVF